MSKAFPVLKTHFIRNAETGANFQFRLKPMAGFAKAARVKVTLNGVEQLAPVTSSKGWTEAGATLYYLWLTLPGSETGWITSDPEQPFVDGLALELVEGQSDRTDPERKLLTGEAAPNYRRLQGFKAALEAKKTAPATPAAEAEQQPEPAAEQPKGKKGKKQAA